MGEEVGQRGRPELAAVAGEVAAGACLVAGRLGLGAGGVGSVAAATRAGAGLVGWRRRFGQNMDGGVGNFDLADSRLSAGERVDQALLKVDLGADWREWLGKKRIWADWAYGGRGMMKGSMLGGRGPRSPKGWILLFQSQRIFLDLESTYFGKL